MFCIFHQYCGKAVDNGHCSVFEGTQRFAKGVSRCDNITALPEDKWAVKKEVKVVNALKASKRAATGAPAAK
jgi:hypothetical protein